MKLPPPLKMQLKYTLSGALGAMLSLVLLVGMLGARGGGDHGRREGPEDRGFARQVLSRLDAIDHQVRALNAQVEALAPQVAQVQSDVSTLASGGGGGSAAPPQVFSLQLCVKAGLAGEAGYSGEQALKVEGQGRLGAEAYGNGLMAQLRAVPGAKIGGGVKGDAGGELQGCFDLRALAQRIQAGTPPFPMSPGQQQIVTKMAATDQATLAGKLLDFASLTSLDPTALEAALDHVPQLTADADPLKLAEPVNNLTELAQFVPLSFQARTRLQDVGATFLAFEQQRDLCGLSLPPALANMVDPICTAAANEPLATALQSTATQVSNIRTRVISLQSITSGISSVVNRICHYVPGC